MMRMRVTTLTVALLLSAVLIASCDRRTASRNVEMAPCVADLEKTAGTATRLLSGQEIESCIRGKQVSFYSDNGIVFLNSSEHFMSDGKWAVDRHGAALVSYFGQWYINQDKACIKQIEIGAYCRVILLNQNDQTLFMPQDSAKSRWTRIIIESSAYEGHMGKR